MGANETRQHRDGYVWEKLGQKSLARRENEKAKWLPTCLKREGERGEKREDKNAETVSKILTQGVNVSGDAEDRCPQDSYFFKSSAIVANCSNAASRSAAISAAMTSGPGR